MLVTPRIGTFQNNAMPLKLQPESKSPPSGATREFWAATTRGPKLPGFKKKKKKKVCIGHHLKHERIWADHWLQKVPFYRSPWEITGQ